MRTVNITVSVEEDTKKQFSDFCENVGMNVTTAFNMFMKAVIRTRELPFSVTDVVYPNQSRAVIVAKAKEALMEARSQALSNGTSEMTMDEIDEEITACRQQKRVTGA